MTLSGTEATLRLAPTKIRPPSIDDRVTQRPRVERLLEGDTRIVLVVAPAGYGKTVSAAQWAHRQAAATAWFTVDDHDNSPARFWKYIAAALSRALDGLGDETMGAIDDWAIDGLDMVTVLLSELGDERAPMALVLDDLHHITAPEILKQLEYFVERTPEWLRIVLVTRSVPSLPIARWQARGLVSQIRQPDLMLQRDEAHAVLRSMSFLQLTEPTEQQLVELAGGWPAALQLAGLALRDRHDADVFVSEQLQSDRVLFDFVVGEVLDRLPVEERDAVLALSMLDDIDSARCEAMTGCSDGEAQLHLLARLGLPLVAVGTDRRTFRFHHLFRALVRLELRIRDEPMVEALHRRAAVAELAAGDRPAAVRHLVAVGDHDAVFELVFEPVWELYRSGSMHALGQWLDQFQLDFVGSDPARITRVATTLSLAGRPMEAEMWNERAESATGGQHFSPELVLSRMLVHLGRADTDAVRVESKRYGHVEHQDLMVDDPDARFSSIMAINALLEGRCDEAASWVDSIGATRERPERLRAVGHPARSAWLAYEVGELDRADRTADLALDSAGVDGRGAPHALIELHVAKAKVAAERMDLAAARTAADTAVELASLAASPMRPMLHHELAHEALLMAIEGEFGVESALDSLAAMSSGVMADSLRERYRLLEAELLGRARRWDHCEHVLDALQRPSVRRQLVTARVALGRRQPVAAGAALDAAGDLSTAPLRHQIEAALLRHLSDGQQGRHLRRSVELGATNGFVWTFRREGAVLDEALRTLLDADPRWRTTLLAMSMRSPGAPAPSAEPPLVEPLSARELEVLQLFPTHMSTVEMAHRLFVSSNTVRTHVKTIYRKLGVNSRSDAVRRSGALGLIGPGDATLRR